MRRERGRNRKREVGNGKRRTLRDLESEGVCVCVCFLKRTQHEDDVVLLKLLLPHVSSFILHKHAHMVNFFSPHSALCLSLFLSPHPKFFFSPPLGLRHITYKYTTETCFVWVLLCFVLYLTVDTVYAHTTLLDNHNF